MKLWLVVAVALAAGILAIVAAALTLWPQVALSSSPTALARLELPGFAGHITAVSVRSTAGHAVPVAVRDGALWPLAKLTGGERLTVGVTVRRPRWAAWLVGHTERRTFALTTPDAHLVRTVLQVPAGRAVELTFDKPVAVVWVAGSRRRLAPPRTVVPLATASHGESSAGTTVVAAAARTWERLSRARRVSWFSAHSYAQVLATPHPDDELTPTARLTLTFSKPVAQVLGSFRPTVSPKTPGRWRQSGAYTLSFRPSGFGFALGERVSSACRRQCTSRARPIPAA